MTSHNINLYFSHEVEQLATHLVEQVAAEQRSKPNPLAPCTVIVPNANMQRYLQLHMSESQGISANIEFPFLEVGLSQYLNLFEDQNCPQMWSQNDLSIRIFALLTDEIVMAKPQMQVIKGYFADSDAGSLLSLKRWQLANRLAVLFISYELQRPEMVVGWLTGHHHFDRSQDPMLVGLEQAEQFLYRLVYESSEHDIANSLFQRFQEIDWNLQKPVDQHMHLFTPTRLSAFHRHLLSHMAQFLDVHIYQLNVCCEYWEDLTTEGEDRWMHNIQSQPIWARNRQGEILDEVEALNQETFYELDDEHTENPLLKAWAKPGRESLRLFSQLEDDAIHLNVSFHPNWLLGQGSRNQGALHVIQDSILYRQQKSGTLQDHSQLNTLKFAQAPSIHREVEAVYNSVLSNLKNNPDLNLSDVALLVTDMDRYRTVITQVFAEMDSQLSMRLPYTMIDSTVTTESRYAQAVLGLLDLLDSHFMRADVLKWLANDCVKQQLGLSNEDLSDWLNWCSQLGIYDGFDQLYAVAAATNPTINDAVTERFTWQQGLRRMRLSLVSLEGETVTQDVESMGTFCWIIESLHRWHLNLKHAMTAAEWQQHLFQLLATFTAIPAEQSREEQVKLALHAALEQLVKQVGSVTLSLPDIKLYIEQTFNQLSASKGNYLSGGLVCAALLPMRPIPFKITYVLGLDERSFPGDVYQDSLDLTQRNRRLGDINKIENMNYLFLETLMCTRAQLYLSYIGKDLIKDESISPASTWQQLHDYATDLMDADALGMNSYPVTEIPLDSVTQLLNEPDPLDEAWLINHMPLDHRKAQLKVDGRKNIHDIEEQADKRQIQKPEFNDQQEVESVDVVDLARILENPVLSYLDQLGGSKQLIDDEFNTEHEPFALDGLSRYQLFDAAIGEYLNQYNDQDPPSLPEVISTCYDNMASRSQLPIQLFAELDDLYALENHDSFQTLKSVLEQTEAMSGPVVFGDAWHSQTPAIERPAITINQAGQDWTLRGSWEGLYLSAGEISHQVVVTSSKSAVWHKSLIKPFLFWCMAKLDDQVNISDQFQLIVVFRNQVKFHTFQSLDSEHFQFGSSEKLVKYLGCLLSAFNTPQQINLPFETIHELKVAEGERTCLIDLRKYQGKRHVFAYDPGQISEQEYAILQKKYEEHAAGWLEDHGYYEMLKAMSMQLDGDALRTYRERLFPLYVLTGAKLP